MQHTVFRPSAEQKRILIVEDEAINLEILSHYLEHDYVVLTATNGRDALAAVHAQYDTISLILLDLHLPDMHGLELLRQLKADPRYARVPVIVITADSDAEVESLTLGAIDFIPKPYPQQKVVLARILRTVELSEDRDTLRWTERDNLTGLYNKEFFYRYAVQLDTYHKDTPTDAIVLDVDHFHTVNERYGKSYGDEVLHQIAANALKLVENSGGLVCRSEADTFLVYCPHRTDYASVLEATSFGVDENRIRLRMGVYANVDKSLDIERRFDRAKMAADTVRGSFTKSIGLYDHSMHEAELLAEQLIEDFPAAIRDGQFEVYYQPKFDIRPEDPVLNSAEALVRWRHPRMGMVSPGVFVPLFEANGLIQNMDHYVWSKAAADIRSWKDTLGISLPVSVNVSRVDLYDPRLIDRLQSILTENGLNSEDLLLEITESAYTEDSQQIVDTVKRLRELGFRIEMDDFGSGYSSLSMLSSMPIDALKLDMQFIRNAFKERRDTRLLEAMIQLADAFGVPTIAEGVETAEQTLTLKMMGCDLIQGYYFSRPLPAHDFRRFLVENRSQACPLPEKERRARRDRFTYDALHDSLTGLYNYSAFDILFHDSDHDHIAVLLGCVDNYEALKKEKDTAALDRTVRRVAEVLRRNFRSVDHICRLQEDEFAVIMTRITDTDEELIRVKLQSLQAQLAGKETCDEPIYMSFGAAISDKAQPGSDVFRNAEAALQQQKKTRQTGYTMF